MLDALRPQHGVLTLAGLMALLAGRDPGAVRVVSDAAELVGRQLAAACNLLAPQRVVLVGAMAEAGELVLGPIRAALHREHRALTSRPTWCWARWAPGTPRSARWPWPWVRATGCRWPRQPAATAPVSPATRPRCPGSRSG